MTTPLLPRKDLTVLLTRRCGGETVRSLAQAYNIGENQVGNLLSTHKAQYRCLKAALGNPPSNPWANRKSYRTTSQGPVQQYRQRKPSLAHDIERECLKCGRIFWTDSLFIRRCSPCKASMECRGMDFAFPTWRGAR